jgi:hypothetical protein
MQWRAKQSTASGLQMIDEGPTRGARAVGLVFLLLAMELLQSGELLYDAGAIASA